MARIVRIAGAQLGPISRLDDRASVATRMLALMEQAVGKQCDLIVFPELAFTTFFPRWYCENCSEVDRYFDSEFPNPTNTGLFEFARQNSLGVCVGYAERVEENGRVRHFNSAVIMDQQGALVGKYRKIHLPGHAEYDDKRTHQHLEKRYFEVGNLGFPVWNAFGGRLGMAICNDRRWPETYRVMALDGAELILIGYNTPATDSLSDESVDLRMFHNHLTMQAGAYQNAAWVVGVAKAGIEDGHALMGGSVIIAPTGEIVVQARTEGDELIVADCDLDRGRHYRQNTFNFEAHRQPQFYQPIAQKSKSG